MIKKQFTLYLENKPGNLAKVTKMLASEKVNIDGISVSESTDVGLVQIVVNNAARTKKLLKKAGLPYTVQDVAILGLKNEPGALSGFVAKLAKAKLNINYVYATSCQCSNDCKCNVIVSAPDIKKVEELYGAS